MPVMPEAGRQLARLRLEGCSMAHEAAAATGAGKLVIRNIGLVLSGMLGNPILDANTIVAVEGRIASEVHTPGRRRDVVGGSNVSSATSR
jgi:hypothetical protein